MDIERTIRPELPKEKKLISEFLTASGLTFTGRPDYTTAILRNGQIIAAGSLQGKVLKHLAVAEAYQGEGLLLKIISSLISYGNSQDIHSFQLFTKAENSWFFQTAGFQLIAEAKPYAALLEWGPENIQTWLADVQAQLPAEGNMALGCIVMNANPFTLGHQALVQHARQHCDFLLIFVVQEDASFFAFPDRLSLVRQGTQAFANVLVLAGGDYIISQATFPTYFVKGQEALIAQSRLDATVFARRIAPVLKLNKRFVAQEPYDKTTNAYNQALAEILPQAGIELEVIQRAAVAGQPISASRVREALSQSDLETVRQLVPATTYDYLLSEKGSNYIGASKATQEV